MVCEGAEKKNMKADLAATTSMALPAMNKTPPTTLRGKNAITDTHLSRYKNLKRIFIFIPPFTHSLLLHSYNY